MSTPGQEPPNDSHWIVRAQAGDVQSFGPLIDLYLPCVRALVAMRLPVPHLVDEIAHETFVHAFRHLAEFTVGTSFRGWLRAIATQLIRAEFQRFHRQQANQSRYAEARHAEWLHQSPMESDTPEAEYLEECLQRAPPAMQRLLSLKYAEGRSTEEIATAISRSLEWVRVTLFRARNQLRDCIEGKMERAGHGS